MIIKIVLVILVVNIILNLFRKIAGSPSQTRTGAQHNGYTGKSSSTADPFTILNVPRSASKDQIKDAYRCALKEYHPDKVAHLGADLQDLAKARTREINDAYKSLMNR